MKTKLSLLYLFLFTLTSNFAWAEYDHFGLGTGRNGALTIATNTTINAYAGITGPLAPGDNTIVVGTIRGAAGGFAAGDLIMVWQSTGLLPVPAAGTPGPFSMTSSNVGRWELARVAMVSGSTLTLTAPLIRSYSTQGSQVIRVPEYTSVTINSGRQVTSYAWDGTCGGIIAFLATGTVTNNGQVNANAVGFRGGMPVNDLSGAAGATGLDEPAPLGAQKGEGLAINRFGASHTGRGNVVNGAGGGVALKAGGGGGGNGAAGGRGGNSDGLMDGNRPVGGLGGGSLTFDVLTQLFPGGGGGAGHNSDASAVAGGRGGGVVFIRCNQLSGTGTINANGAAAAMSTADGGSGGGAGGTVYLRTAGSASFGGLTASGGAGGNVNDVQIGPGGGGGGGVILLQRSAGSGTAVAAGGTNGMQPDPGAPGGMPFGAMAGSTGLITTLATGMVAPAAPALVTPANGSLVNGKPTITGTGPASTSIELYLDDLLLGTVATDGGGNFSYPVTATLTDGAHTLRAYAVRQAIYSPSSLTSSFTSSATLPVRFTSLQARAQQTNGQWQVKGSFSTTSEDKVAAFVIERRANGGDFAAIARLVPINQGSTHSYHFTDAHPQKGLNSYRIKEESLNGSNSYSATISVSVNGASPAMHLHPNPVVNSAQLQVVVREADLVTYSISDASGRLLIQRRLEVPAGTSTHLLGMQNLQTGLYHLRVKGKEIEHSLTFIRR